MKRASAHPVAPKSLNLPREAQLYPRPLRLYTKTAPPITYDRELTLENLCDSVQGDPFAGYQ
jgi:hypothetical protein